MANPTRDAPYFRRWISWLLAILLSAVATYTFSGDRFDRFDYPGYAAVRFYDGSADLAAGAATTVPWLRVLLEFNGEDERHVRSDARLALGEVLAYTELDSTYRRFDREQRAHVRAHLAVLLAEEGASAEAADVVRPLGATPEEQQFVRLFSLAYPQAADGNAIPQKDQTQTLPLLQWGWAARQVTRRLREQGVDPKAFGLPRDERLLLEVPAVPVFAWLSAAWLLTLLAGFVALLIAVRRGAAWTRVAAGFTVAPWSLGTAFAVLVRGMAGGAVLTTVAWVLWRSGLQQRGSPPASSVLAMLPILWWCHRALVRPYAGSWTATFGLRIDVTAIGRVLALSAAVISLVFVGDTVLAHLAAAVGLQTDWTDAVLEEILYPQWRLRPSVTIEGVFGVPFCEEILFRGIVYASCRRIMAPLGAAGLSALIFAALHGLSPAAFTSLAWTGIVLALAYERSGSLIPCMLAHAINNGWAVASQMLL